MRKKIKLYFFNIYKNMEIKVLKKTQLEGFGIIEMLLLLAIVVALIILFKGEIETIVNNAIDSIKGKAGKIVS